jgi:hypothetical protein
MHVCVAAPFDDDVACSKILQSLEQQILTLF